MAQNGFKFLRKLKDGSCFQVEIFEVLSSLLKSYKQPQTLENIIS